MSLQVSALETQCFSFFRVQLAALHSRRTCGAVGTAHKILAELWSSPTDTSLLALFANGLEETMRTFTIANDRRQHVFCTHFKTHTITHKRWHVSNVLTAYNSAVHNECAEECTRNLPHPLRHYARLVCLQRQKLCARRTYKTLANPQQHLVLQTYNILAHPLRNFETRQLTSSLPTLNADNAGWMENC